MQKDMLQSIDDSALETVSGGHHGHLIEVIEAVRADIREHVGEAIEFAHDVAGSALVHAGERLERLGNAIKG
jgi:RNA binding exosome subunit